MISFPISGLVYSIHIRQVDGLGPPEHRDGPCRNVPNHVGCSLDPRNTIDLGAGSPLHRAKCHPRYLHHSRGQDLLGLGSVPGPQRDRLDPLRALPYSI